MLGVFQKYLRKELGAERYENYCQIFEKNKKSQNPRIRKESSEKIYEDLYEFLKDKDTEELRGKLESLVDSMCETVSISKGYIFAFCFYLGSSLFLIFKQLNPMVTLVSLLLISALFLYKTCEYVVNRYCYVDANIILVYKAVLEGLLIRRTKTDEST